MVYLVFIQSNKGLVSHKWWDTSLSCRGIRLTRKQQLLLLSSYHPSHTKDFYSPWKFSLHITLEQLTGFSGLLWFYQSYWIYIALNFRLLFLICLISKFTPLHFCLHCQSKTDTYVLSVDSVYYNHSCWHAYNHSCWHAYLEYVPRTQITMVPCLVLLPFLSSSNLHYASTTTWLVSN